MTIYLKNVFSAYMLKMLLSNNPLWKHIYYNSEFTSLNNFTYTFIIINKISILLPFVYGLWYTEEHPIMEILNTFYFSMIGA